MINFLARQKLHEYLAQRQLTLEYETSEKGPPSERIYLAELSFELDGKRYKAKDSAANKKSAQKKVALDIVVRLFKEKKISANIVHPGQYVDPRRQLGFKTFTEEKYIFSFLSKY